ncbi:MAG: Na+/H+ antiporter NhaA [Acidobacteria bacterium]|nr:Na+/H+ antiporter NhaA [Acidobacteriota bacterium]
MKKERISFAARFFQMESAGGILLVGAAFLAIILANSPLSSVYELLIDTPVAIKIGGLEIAKPLLLWVNDGLMAVFFFLVGLELKRELMEGELSDKRKIILPGLGAVGGMAVPAAIYVFFNAGTPLNMKGWAIPAATDIAFALGILSLLGSKVPRSLKVFLTSLAIFDDIGAILIIAFFYTGGISLTALAVVAACVPVLFFLNRSGVSEKSLYVIVGIVMWVAMLKSGVHATLSGVVLAMFIPMNVGDNTGISPLKSMESDLHAAVAFFILPVFAFCNAGISVNISDLVQVLHPVPLGIALGLFFGKQAGVFLFCWLGIKLHLAELPKDISWMSLYGTAVLCGIGFTMSLFVGSLAFGEAGVAVVFDERLGIILGSLLSGVLGYFLLRMSLRGKPRL